MRGADRFAGVRDVIASGIGRRVYPAASIEVGTVAQALWTEAFGTLTYEPDAPPATTDTVFDLASLTKVIVTATLAMRHVEDGRLHTSDKVSAHLPRFAGSDRAHVTVRDLLEHCAGLTAWLPFFRDHAGRADFESGIGLLPLEYVPWTRSVYSDLGFILLGFILEDVGGASLARQIEAMLGDPDLRYSPPPSWRPRTAPTERDSWRGRLLVGEVHDENAWALGGVAGHAGLFGTAAAVGRFARLVLQTLRAPTLLGTPETLARFVRRTTVPRSSRAMGWDTMLPTSSCGTKISPRAFGHVGFTGTSLWIDPDRDLYVVFLTNRVHPTREGDAFRAVRPAVHDAVIDALGS